MGRRTNAWEEEIPITWTQNCPFHTSIHSVLWPLLYLSNLIGLNPNSISPSIFHFNQSHPSILYLNIFQFHILYLPFIYVSFIHPTCIIRKSLGWMDRRLGNIPFSVTIDKLVLIISCRKLCDTVLTFVDIFSCMTCQIL